MAFVNLTSMFGLRWQGHQTDSFPKCGWQSSPPGFCRLLTLWICQSTQWPEEAFALCGAAFGRCQASCTGEGFKKEHNELEKTWLPVKQNQEQAGKYPPEREGAREKEGQKNECHHLTLSMFLPQPTLRVLWVNDSLRERVCVCVCERVRERERKGRGEDWVSLESLSSAPLVWIGLMNAAKW